MSGGGNEWHPRRLKSLVVRGQAEGCKGEGRRQSGAIQGFDKHRTLSKPWAQSRRVVGSILSISCWF